MDHGSLYRLGHVPIRGVPSGSVEPVQNTSAALARRGQTIGSRFSGEDCSLHNGIWPIHKQRLKTHLKDTLVRPHTA
ncbi:hypothetical protein PHLCEN_2v13373 [Hermanssonia centrifuga]|uniref:Uncharacterized protein n=1 Tax=Hermanssonia centrifuga TaxID=98765 RepID=A0A2R6NEF5_9APHY|nr:hypothetical protein PHLCEN_2v13373 [Hermanssonia centrifuga]